jgi:hypothetical protein
MTYEVEIQNKGMYAPDCTKKEAIALAQEFAQDKTNCGVYISWFRASDGQHGYLNPNGAHAITGQAWDA